MASSANCTGGSTTCRSATSSGAFVTSRPNREDAGVRDRRSAPLQRAVVSVIPDQQSAPRPTFRAPSRRRAEVVPAHRADARVTTTTPPQPTGTSDHRGGCRREHNRPVRHSDLRPFHLPPLNTEMPKPGKLGPRLVRGGFVVPGMEPATGQWTSELLTQRHERDAPGVRIRIEVAVPPVAATIREVTKNGTGPMTAHPQRRRRGAQDHRRHGGEVDQPAGHSRMRRALSHGSRENVRTGGCGTTPTPVTSTASSLPPSTCRARRRER